MLIFQNPGLIDLAAVTTMGASVKRHGAFGRFGTGLKFAIATILRGGGEIAIWRGTQRHVLGTVPTEITGVMFNVVTLDGQPMGITTNLGRDWEPWMVLRELGCNALDEAGSFGPGEDFVGQEGQTAIVVLWDQLDTAYAQRAQLFVEGVPLFENEKLRILPGPSSHLFYRGVRVFKTGKPCQFTYDILAEQTLTEDRTLIGCYAADQLILGTWLTMTNVELARQAITTGKDYHEADLDFTNAGWSSSPSTEFLKAANVAREADKDNLSDSARKVLAQASRQQAAENTTRARVQETNFTHAIGHLYELGMEFADDQQFVEVDELPGDLRSMLEGGAVFMLRALMHASSREVAAELIKRWVDLQPGIYALDQGVALLAPKLLDAVPECRRQREEREEWEARQAAHEAELEARRVAKLEAESQAPEAEGPASEG